MLQEDMTNDQIALDRAWVFDNTEYINGLYETYGETLKAIREEQKGIYSTIIGQPMFDDLESEFLTLSILDMVPDIVVEVGSGSCWSSMWILQGLKHNGVGRLTSYDIQDMTANIPHHLRDGRFTFKLGDAMLADFPGNIEFLLMDADHNEPFVNDFMEKAFPLVRSGGKIGIHDVFAHPTPAHGEAIAAYRYMDRIGVQCYTLSSMFPDTHESILLAREKAGIKRDDLIHDCPVNSLLILEVP
ncbi:MAG: class I SAM-dependent methyltransferase [Pseudomonadota bacterium]|uniref:Putative methyltransferase n=2 Tax=viral metagenome TaxID=1070528 RepID=A0A6M3XAS0_9ZZZZ